MGDLTYNQGIHGAQDTANAMVRAGRPFHVVTEDWHGDAFRDAVGRWARAAAAVTRWRSLKVAVFGYAMNGMGDIRVDEHALLRALGPQVDAIAPGRRCTRAAAAVAAERGARADRRRGRALRDRPAAVGASEREDHARMQLGIEQMLRDGGYGAYSTHFDAIGEDGRFARLPLAAASSLMAKGYGYGAEGDALTAALMSAAARRCSATTQFTEMYAMDFATRLDPDEPHGRGQLGARAPGPARAADQAAARHRRSRRPADVPVPVRARARRRSPRSSRSAASASGCWSPRGRSSTPTSCPRWRCRTGFFRPDPGCGTAWTPGCGWAGRTTRCSTPAARREAWRMFCELAGIEFAAV